MVIDFFVHLEARKLPLSAREFFTVLDGLPSHPKLKGLKKNTVEASSHAIRQIEDRLKASARRSLLRAVMRIVLDPVFCLSDPESSPGRSPS